MAEDEKGTSSWYKVSTWNGNPQEQWGFKREMGWWIASLDPEACRKFNVAARWTLRQVGVVRARCEEFDPDDLAGAAEVVSTDPQTGEKRVLKGFGSEYGQNGTRQKGRTEETVLSGDP